MTTGGIFAPKASDLSRHHGKGVQTKLGTTVTGIPQRARHQAAIAPTGVRPAGPAHVMVGRMRFAKQLSGQGLPKQRRLLRKPARPGQKIIQHAAPHVLAEGNRLKRPGAIAAGYLRHVDMGGRCRAIG